MRLEKINTSKKLRQIVRSGKSVYHDLDEESVTEPQVRLKRGRNKASPDKIKECKLEISRYQTITEAAKGSPSAYNVLRYAGLYDEMADYFRERKPMSLTDPDIDIHLENDIKCFSTLNEYKKYRPKWYAFAMKEYPFLLDDLKGEV